MSPRDLDTRTPPETRASEALRSLSTPRPEETFRAGLKRQFVAGEVETMRRRTGLVAPWWRNPRFGMTVAAAAAALIAVGFVTANRGPRWSIVSALGDDIAVIEHRPIPLGHTDDLQRALRPGARIQLGAAAALEIEARGHMVLQISPGTEIVLPKTPGRWWGREMAAVVERGEIRVATGASFKGARLRVITPEASLRVTGTTLAVICEPQGTCVCVYDGTVEVGSRNGPMVPVERGNRRFVFHDGRAPETAAIRPIEQVELGRFRDQHRDRLE